MHPGQLSRFTRRWFLLSSAVTVLLGACLSLRAAEPKQVLVVTVTEGFRHGSIPTAMKVLAELGTQSKAYTVDFAFTAADLAVKMTPERLRHYDAFIFANTTGTLPLPDKSAFLQAVREGKGFVGIHSASDTFHGADGAVDPYIDMLGGEFLRHGPQVGVECLVQDRDHPATRHLGESYSIEKEEIYLFKNFAADRVKELLVLDKHPNNKGQPGRFPVAWSKEYGEGRVFYTALGHREDVWENELFQQHLLGGIQWALGLDPK